MSAEQVILALLLAGGGFAAVVGVAYGRGRVATIEDYITARRSLGTWATTTTLVASGMGAWILFSPAEAATWGGLVAILGYGLGAAAPLLIFIFLGRRLRQLIPEGHSLTEYVWHRYGSGLYALTLIVTLFYMFIFLAAEITAIALIAKLVAGVPLWLTAFVVIVITFAYTIYGGLRASVLTDVVQAALILPLLAALLLVGYQALGGFQPGLAGLSERDPQLLDFGHPMGWQAALTFIIAISAANLFHQGYWQRVYAARDERTLGASFLLAALAVIPLVVVMGLFGLAAVGLDRVDHPSVALFSVLLEVLPPALLLALILLGLTLAMSSIDSLLNGIASLVVVEAGRFMRGANGARLLRLSRWLSVLLALPLLWVASQGYSVLYLFLLANLACTAAAFPVFYGLYSQSYTGKLAIWSMLAGLVAGGLLFPDPAMTRGHLLGAFVLAAVVPVMVSLALTPRRTAFDLGSLKSQVRAFRD
jgi:Na+/proline symporter